MNFMMIHENLNDLSSTRIELRERIINTAMNSFRKHGIKPITMDDIANTLSISKRTLYEIFQDKETLLMDCLLKREEEFKEYMEKVAGESENVLEVILKFYMMSLEIYHSTNKRFFEDMNKYPKVKEMHDIRREENSEKGIAFFKKGVEQGFFRSDVNFGIMHILVREQLNMLMNTDICKDYSFIEVYESIMFTYVRGICTEKGHRILEDFIKSYRS